MMDGGRIIYGEKEREGVPPTSNTHDHLCGCPSLPYNCLDFLFSGSGDPGALPAVLPLEKLSNSSASLLGESVAPARTPPDCFGELGG